MSTKVTLASLQQELHEKNAQFLESKGDLANTEAELQETRRMLAEETARADRNARLVSEREKSLTLMTSRRNRLEDSLLDIEKKLHVGQVSLNKRLAQFSKIALGMTYLKDDIEMLAQIAPEIYHKLRDLRFELGGILPESRKWTDVPDDMSEFSDTPLTTPPAPWEKFLLANRVIVEALEALIDSGDPALGSLFGLSDNEVEYFKNLSYHDKYNIIHNGHPIWKFRFTGVPFVSPAEGQPRRFDNEAKINVMLREFPRVQDPIE